MRRRVWAMVLAAQVGLVGALVVRLDRPPPPPAGLRNLVLVSIDTLRADHLGAYGATHVATPHLDELAHESIVLDAHFSAAPTTLASHATMMTGTWPHTHGIPRNGFVLDAGQHTLGESLSAAGFVTGAVVGATPLDVRTGLDQGFDHYDGDFGDPANHDDRDGQVVTDRALAWVDRAYSGPEGPPFFLFVHYFDVHTPYGAPGPGRLRYDPDAVREAERLDPEAEIGSFAHVRATRRRLKRGDPDGPAHARALDALYRSGVSHVDAAVGRLLDGLAQRGHLDASLVLVTSDHGEVFERPEERWDHGYSLVDEVVRVPLLVRFPLGEHGGRRISRLTRHVDVLATVLDLLGLPERASEGLSFADLLRDEPARHRRPPAFAEATKPWTQVGTSSWLNADRLKMIRTARRKLVVDPVSGEHRLYLLEQDPGETVDRSEDQAGLRATASLVHALKAWSAAADPPPAVPVDDAGLRAALEALGYTDDG